MQRVSSDKVIPLEPIQDDICDVLFDDYIEYSVSLKGSEDPILVVVGDAFVKLCAADCFAVCLLKLSTISVNVTQTANAVRFLCHDNFSCC